MEPLTDRPKRKISFAAVDLIHSTSPSSRIKASSWMHDGKIFFYY